jgi:hypothetical protein
VASGDPFDSVGEIVACLAWLSGSMWLALRKAIIPRPATRSSPRRSSSASLVCSLNPRCPVAWIGAAFGEQISDDHRDQVRCRNLFALSSRPPVLRAEQLHEVGLPQGSPSVGGPEPTCSKVSQGQRACARPLLGRPTHWRIGGSTSASIASRRSATVALLASSDIRSRPRRRRATVANTQGASPRRGLARLQFDLEAAWLMLRFHPWRRLRAARILGWAARGIRGVPYVAIRRHPETRRLGWPRARVVRRSCGRGARAPCGRPAAWLSY